MSTSSVPSSQYSSYFSDFSSGNTHHDEEEDQFCPSWLLNFQSEGLGTSESNEQANLNILTERSSIICQNRRGKRQYESGSLLETTFDTLPLQTPLKLYGISEYGNKRIDSPIKENAFQGKMENANKIQMFQKTLIELVQTEIAYHKDLSLCLTIYKSLLDNCRDYKNILTDKEEDIIFNNISQLIKDSKLFTKEIIGNLISLSVFKNPENSEKLKEGGDYNVKQLVLNCDLSKLNIGLILSNHIKSEYSKDIKYYFVKHDLQIQILNEKIKFGGPLISNWLKECNFLSKNKTSSWSLETLLIKPIQRIMKYPLLIKGLIDNFSFQNQITKFELSSSLIKINELITRLNDSERVNSMNQDIREHDLVQVSSAITEHNSNGIMSIKQSDKDGAAIAHSNLEKQLMAKSFEKRKFDKKQFDKLPVNRQEYVLLASNFKLKYEKLKEVKECFGKLNKNLITFLEGNLAYAALWKDFFQFENMEEENGYENYIRSIYASYIDKIKHEQNNTVKINQEIKEKIINPIELVLIYCEKTRDKINEHRKYRSAYVSYIKDSQNVLKFNANKKLYDKAQHYIKIENMVKNEVPKLLSYLDEFLRNSLISFNFIYLKWLKELIGERSLNEFSEMKNLNKEQKNLDIIQYYFKSRELNKLALKTKLKEEGKEYSFGYYLEFYSSGAEL